MTMTAIDSFAQKRSSHPAGLGGSPANVRGAHAAGTKLALEAEKRRGYGQPMHDHRDSGLPQRERRMETNFPEEA